MLKVLATVCVMVTIVSSSPLLRNSYGLPIIKLDNDYGVPKVIVPSTSYGSPIIPSIKYGVPTDYPAPISIPAVLAPSPINSGNQFELPTEQQVPVPAAPANVYGVPTIAAITPSPIYGPPVPVEVPNTPAPVYGLPIQKVRVPITTVIQYTIPKVQNVYGPPAQAYGPPSAPAEVYGPPAAPAPVYGTPAIRQPELIYGLPPQVQRVYGVPTIPSNTYGTPSRSLARK